MAAFEILVRPATAEDMPTIAALRQAFFAAHGVAPYPPAPATFWLVAQYRSATVSLVGAVQGLIDLSLQDPQVRQLIITDTYCLGDRVGKVALKRLGAYVHGMADDLDFEIIGNILPDDPQWHALSAAHHYAVVAHVVQRKRRSEREADAGSNSISDRGGHDGGLEHAAESGAQEQRKPAGRQRTKRPGRVKRRLPAAKSVAAE